MRRRYRAIRRSDRYDAVFVGLQTAFLALLVLTRFERVRTTVVPSDVTGSLLAFWLAVALSISVVGHWLYERFASADDPVETAAEPPFGVRYRADSRLFERGCAAVFLLAALYLSSLHPWGTGDILRIPIFGLFVAGFAGFFLVASLSIRTLYLAAVSARRTLHR